MRQVHVFTFCQGFRSENVVTFVRATRAGATRVIARSSQGHFTALLLPFPGTNRRKQSHSIRTQQISTAGGFTQAITDICLRTRGTMKTESQRIGKEAIM